MSVPRWVLATATSFRPRAICSITWSLTTGTLSCRPGSAGARSCCGPRALWHAPRVGRQQGCQAHFFAGHSQCAAHRQAEVWLATDCDREGQLIGQEILEHYNYFGYGRACGSSSLRRTRKPFAMPSLPAPSPNSRVCSAYTPQPSRAGIVADQIFTLSLTRRPLSLWARVRARRSGWSREDADPRHRVQAQAGDPHGLRLPFPTSRLSRGQGRGG